jgi:hypothetical protein
VLPVPVDGQIPAPLAFFNAPPAFPEQPAQAPRKLSANPFFGFLRIHLKLALILEGLCSVLGSGGRSRADGCRGTAVEGAKGAGAAGGKLPDVIHRFPADGLGGVHRAGVVSGGPAPRWWQRGWELLRRFATAPATHAG